MNFEAISQELIRAIRGEFSQSYVARKLGVRSTQIGRWESGERRISWRDFCRLAEVCKVDLIASMRSMRPVDADITDGHAIAARVMGGAPLTEVARQTGISRYTLMRWMKGEGTPTLCDILILVHKCQFTLFEWLRNLVDMDRLPSAYGEFADRQKRKAVYYEMPEVAGILCALRLDSYQSLQAHEPGFIAQKIGISEENESRCLKALVEVGKIEWDGSHYVPLEENLELTDSKEFNRFCRYWFERAQRYLDELPNPYPAIGYGMDIQPTSAQTMQKVKDEYKAFYRRVRSILSQDTGTKDRVYVFNALFFDLEARFQHHPNFLWGPIEQPTNPKERAHFLASGGDTPQTETKTPV